MDGLHNRLSHIRLILMHKGIALGVKVGISIARMESRRQHASSETERPRREHVGSRGARVVPQGMRSCEPMGEQRLDKVDAALPVDRV